MSGCAILGDEDQPMTIGAQLYTVRAALERDLITTLANVAAIGYRQVELANLGGHSPEALSTALKATGLNAVGFHGDWALIKHDPARAIAQAKAVGAPALIMAWMPPEERATLDDWRAWADRCNRAAELSAAAGLGFAWHNHDFEFKSIDAKVPFDLLVERFSPLVKFEIDTYWVKAGGVEPLDVMARLAGRISHLHIKDMARDTNAMADPGLGRLNFPAILKLAREIGVKHLLVERDDSPDPMATLRQGFQYLTSISRLDEPTSKERT
jgi:sugar phosphate isomerase/epimerase